MRRALFDRIIVIPYVLGAVIDRSGLLSAVVGIDCSDITGTAKLTIAVTHCDMEDGSYVPVDDIRLFVDAVMPITISEAGWYQIPIDLLGCKQYIKIDITIDGDADCTYALALGDSDAEPIG